MSTGEVLAGAAAVVISGFSAREGVLLLRGGEGRARLVTRRMAQRRGLAGWIRPEPGHWLWTVEGWVEVVMGAVFLVFGVGLVVLGLTP